MSVRVNGDISDIDVGSTVEAVVDAVAPSPRGIAVAINGEIVPRSSWTATTVVDGDEVEVLGAAQGG